MRHRHAVRGREPIAQLDDARAVLFIQATNLRGSEHRGVALNAVKQHPSMGHRLEPFSPIRRLGGCTRSGRRGIRLIKGLPHDLDQNRLLRGEVVIEGG